MSNNLDSSIYPSHDVDGRSSKRQRIRVSPQGGSPPTQLYHPVKESAIIWKEGTGPSTTGSILVKLAQSGYTREAHQIIGLSHIASLVGRDSDGGLPELWDVMGKKKGNRRRITRLMAVCITRGSLAPERALALIRDHNGDVKAKDSRGRTALHHALGMRYNDDPWPANPLNVALVDVLLIFNPEGVHSLDNSNAKPFDNLLPRDLIIYAKNGDFKHDASLVVIIADALKVYAQSIVGRKSCIADRVPFAMVDSLHSQEVIASGTATRSVCEVLIEIAGSEDGIQACVDAKAPAALVYLTSKHSVRGDNNTIGSVSIALKKIAASNEGLWACIKNNAARALVGLTKTETVMENAETAGLIAEEIDWIAFSAMGKFVLINAYAPEALVCLANTEAVKRNSQAVSRIAAAISIISQCPAGRQACLSAGAKDALRTLSTQQQVRGNGQALHNVQLAFDNLSN